MKNKGVVAIFKKNRFDYYSNFARIGQAHLAARDAVWLSSTLS